MHNLYIAKSPSYFFLYVQAYAWPCISDIVLYGHTTTLKAISSIHPLIPLRYMCTSSLIGIYSQFLSHERTCISRGQTCMHLFIIFNLDSILFHQTFHQCTLDLVARPRCILVFPTNVRPMPLGTWVYNVFYGKLPMHTHLEIT